MNIFWKILQQVVSNRLWNRLYTKTRTGLEYKSSVIGEDFYFNHNIPKPKFPSQTFEQAMRQFVAADTRDMTFVEVWEMGRAQNAALREYNFKKSTAAKKIADKEHKAWYAISLYDRIKHD